ncbi:MAG TPA: hypothetical protein VKB52_08810, partial [Rhodanobacteraceae bacterium]|nr:hypothetical protein [Rhodanobacteraceae bacterium]
MTAAVIAVGFGGGVVVVEGVVDAVVDGVVVPLVEGVVVEDDGVVVEAVPLVEAGGVVPVDGVVDAVVEDGVVEDGV